ncbi:MAG TPA: universal stress protein [Thermoanaerobaculaceae bacterium]|nr:universal stress protein [Thermoanaerobaculaceae bacterium]
MFDPKNILVPTDFSEFSDKALSAAVELAKRFQSKIFLLHVVDSLPQQCADQYCIDLSILRQIEEDSIRGAKEKIQQELSRAHLPGIATETDVREGSPYQEIVRVQQEKQIDLIVMGTHGRRGLDRFMLGSVTERVVRKAACPVLTVHGRAAEFAEAGRLPTTCGGKILLCTDFSERSRRALDYAWSLAAAYNAELTLAHVLETLASPSSLEASVSDARDRLENLAPEGAPQVPSPHVAVRIGKPYEQIIALATEGEFDVVVMSARGEGVRDPAVFGSTTHRVIQLGPCPVLVVPS